MKDLLKALTRASHNLKRASRWHGTGLAVDAKKDDYVYELLCYFLMALQAKQSFRVSVVGFVDTADKMPKARWPKKPGLKKNFSYLDLRDPQNNNLIYQLCPGIKVEDIDGKDRAPDISLQKGDASSAPTYDDLLACWDAKFTSSQGRLPDVAVSDFAFTHTQLNAPVPPPNWTKTIATTAYMRSGLFTNGQASTEPDNTLKRYRIQETSGFPNAPVTRL